MNRGASLRELAYLRGNVEIDLSQIVSIFLRFASLSLDHHGLARITDLKDEEL